MKTFTEVLARADKSVRNLLVTMPPKAVVSMYSSGRKNILKKIGKEDPSITYNPPDELARTLWGIRFRSPIFNAAGMFKNGEGYSLVARQGAGAYLAGTTTGSPRKGNKKDSITQPFTPYPRSKAASNWLGLPNDGHRVVAERLTDRVRINGCPRGVSVSASPGEEEHIALIELTIGLQLYENAGVDFIELNESCPNVPSHKFDHTALKLDEALIRRCEHIAHFFLQKRKRQLPVIVKFSNDTNSAMIPLLMDLLLTLGFDGVNFGNTSTSYKQYEPQIHPSEKKLYEYFTTNFGGGLSGKPLLSSSLSLCTSVMDYLHENPPKHEFHVVRTGGIENPADVIASEQVGISLNQWYTGYFENYSHFGNKIYQKFYEGLSVNK